MLNILFVFLSIIVFGGVDSFAAIPQRPMGMAQPGSADYPFTLGQATYKVNDRDVQVYYPLELKKSEQKTPILVFGHGQAIGSNGYEMTFKHLAQKGVIVIHPGYDRGFFDLDWKRMSSDFIALAFGAIEKLGPFADDQRVMFSGHSKGGFVALISAGNPVLAKTTMKVGSVVAFSPIGFDKTYFNTIPKDLNISLVWPESESIVRRSKIDQIFEMIPSRYKQMILVKDYPELKAGHFMTLNKSYFFGGADGVSAFHYHGVWKWLIGGIRDLDENHRTNPFLYGPEALTSGLENLSHSVLRSW